MATGTIGTVIHATLRTEDLLAAFADELEHLGANNPEHVALAQEARTINPDDEWADEFVSDLMDALNEYAPDGCYFGAHEGDGSDFGFWPCE
jgi:hypothetical protein